MSLAAAQPDTIQHGHPAPMHHLVPLIFRSTPLLFAAVFFAAGIAAHQPLLASWRPTVTHCIATALLIAIAYLTTRYAQRMQIFAIAAAWLALGCTCAALQQHPASRTPITPYADALMRNVEGRVLNVQALNTAPEDPDVSPSESENETSSLPLWSIDIAATRVEEVTPDTSTMVPTSGGVRLLIASTTQPQVRCGDSIGLPVRMRPANRYRDPGVWQYADWLAENDIVVRASTRITSLQPNASTQPDFTCRIHTLQQWTADRLRLVAHTTMLQHLPRWLRLQPQDAALLTAMLVGDRTGIRHAERVHFERTGTFHLVVVAGMHVGLLAAALLWLLTRMGAGRISSTLITLGITTFYAVLTGFGAPVQRALFMTAAYLLARMLARRASSLNPLGFAAIAMLVIKPSSLFDAGFQMTVLAVIAIGGIALPLGEHTFLPYARAAQNIILIRLDAHVHPRLAQFRVFIRLLARIIGPSNAAFTARIFAASVRCILWAVELLLMSILSEILMSLPMMFYFHRLTPAALPANLLAVPLVAPLMIAAALFLFFACIHPLLGAAFSLPAAMLLHLMRTLLHFFSGLSFSELRTPPPASWQIATAICCWTLAVYLVRRSRASAALAVLAITIPVAVLLLPPKAQTHPNTLEVTAIDVGQGDSILAVAPNGTAMLIDAGGPTGRASTSQTESFDIGEEVVSPYLWQRSFRKLDIAVITHAHSDHIGGMAAILRNFHPRELWLSVLPQSAALKEVLQVAHEQNIKVRILRENDSLTWNGVSIQTLAPTRSYIALTPRNNDSLVLRMQWQHASALLAGDAEAQSESTMLVTHRNSLNSTLLKVAHHGSRTSTSENFLNAVHPSAAVISDGRNNTFGHPRMEVLERLATAHVLTYRTDMLGATTFLLSSDGRIAASTSYGQ